MTLFSHGQDCFMQQQLFIVVESERNARVWENSLLIALIYLVNAKVIRCVKKVFYFLTVLVILLHTPRGPFIYYVITCRGEGGQKMPIFDYFHY